MTLGWLHTFRVGEWQLKNSVLELGGILGPNLAEGIVSQK